MSLPDNIYFTVSFPTDAGFLSRQCNAPACGRHFKVHKDCRRTDMHCPYCGEVFSDDQLWTDAQVAFTREAVLHEVEPMVRKEIDDMFRRAFSGPGWNFTPGTAEPPKPPPQPPTQPSVDSELRCPECGFQFQVDGIFGYCPGCRSENLRLYDANLAIIRREIEKGGDPSRALRHAYADLVSTFEIFCRKEAINRSLGASRYQNLQVAREYFRQNLGVDIYAGLDPDHEVSVRRAFQKRHVLEHNDGVLDARYVREIPEDAALEGQKATLSFAELETAAHGVRQMLEVLVTAR